MVKYTELHFVHFANESVQIIKGEVRSAGQMLSRGRQRTKRGRTENMEETERVVKNLEG